VGFGKGGWKRRSIFPLFNARLTAARWFGKELILLKKSVRESIFLARLCTAVLRGVKEER